MFSSKAQASAPTGRALSLLVFLALLALTVTLAVSCNSKPTEPIASSPPVLPLTPTGTLASSAASTLAPPGTFQPTATSTPAPTTKSSATPISALKLPVLGGTPVPQPQVPISPDNVNKITELALWGKGQVNRVAYSPDDKRLAVGTSIGIWLYDTSTLKEFRFINTGNKVYSLAFSPDSTTIYAQTSEAIITWWNMATGERQGSLQVSTLLTAFFLKGARLIAAADGKQIELWDMESGKHLRTLAGYTDDVSSLAFSTDGTLLASGSLDSTIQLWDIKTGRSLLTLKGHSGRVTSLAFSPDGALLASGSYDDTARVWKVKTGAPIWVLEGNRQPSLYRVDNVVFSPDGTMLASGGADDKIRLWDMKTGALLHALEIHQYSLMDMAFSIDGTTLAFVDAWEEAVRLWNVKTGMPRNELIGYQESVSGLVVSPDSTIFVSHFEDGKIELWDPRRGQIARTFEGSTENVPRLALSADGTTLASVHAGRQAGPVTVWVWDVAAGQRLWSWRNDYPRGIAHLTLSSDGKMLASSTEATAFYIYDVRTGKELHNLLGGRNSDLAFSPDGKKLASVSDRVRLWNPETGELLHDIESHGLNTGGLTFSPDSKMVAVGYDDGTIYLLDSETGEMLRALKGHANDVVSVAFSPDGKLLASAIKGGTLHLWDAQTGRLLHTVNTPEVNVMVFSRDSRILALGCLEGTVRLWGVPPD